jgi:signal transduction histidine kinase
MGIGVHADNSKCMADIHKREAKLLSLAVHEFRTPVSVVSGYLRMLLRHFGDGLTSQQQMLVEQGEKSCGTLSALLTELSELAQWESGEAAIQAAPLPIAALLTDVAKDVHEGKDRGVSIAVRDCEAQVQILGDAARITRAFDTLLTATLRERSDATSMLAACRLVDGADGRMVRIAIADANDIDRILEDDDTGSFDLYRGGLGFRLLLAERIIAAHGGRVASPVAARGRLAIVVSLPVAPDAESIG